MWSYFIPDKHYLWIMLFFIIKQRVGVRVVFYKQVILKYLKPTKCKTIHRVYTTLDLLIQDEAMGYNRLGYLQHHFTWIIFI